MAPALISLDIAPKTPADQEKLARALKVLAAEDAELRVSPGQDRSCTVIGAISEAKLEEIVDRLKGEFEVEASVGRPTVAYLESLTQAAEGSATHVGMAPDQGEYAHVSLRVHPGAAGSGYRFEDATIGGSVPEPFMSAIDIGIREAMAIGILRGYPIVDVRVEVYDGSYHGTDSTDAAFRRAAAMAFLRAAENAHPVVLEPVMQVEVRADHRHVQIVLQDLLMRRAEVHTRTQQPDHEVVGARVPLVDLFGFETCLRSHTHGLASCSIRFAHYQPVISGPTGDDDRVSRVGVPRRPAPHLRRGSASVAEPDDGSPATNAEARTCASQLSRTKAIAQITDSRRV